MRLSASGLTCVRGERQVFAGIGFALAAGDALMVTGPNGAGKSSLLRMVAGLLPCAAGRVDLQGGTAELTLAEQCHYLGHRDAVKASLSVREHLDFWCGFLGGGPGDKAVSLATVGLDHLAALPAGYLSAGQRRRLSFARLLAVKRPIWLLDEPTAALDAAAQDMLAAAMSRHRAAGGIILAATHSPLDLEGAGELRLGGAP